MPELMITRMGNPILRKVAADVDPKIIPTEDFQQLIDDMEETMNVANGIGIAAPQVGVSQQLALIKVDPDNPRYPGQDESGLIVFINPKVSVLTDQTQGYWEGCLSVPGLRGYVERATKIKIEFLNRRGEAEELEASEFMAVVFQHELDHLQGILYVDKVLPGNLVYDEEFDEFIAPKLD